jgi:mRNA-degrading endonuclease toxin of MazEF toxin-antitoxin module
MEVHRGEVFYADLSPVVGSEQGGVRPVLIVQNEIGNRHSCGHYIPAGQSPSAHPHQYPGSGYRPCQGQRGAAGADPHAG